MSTSYPGLIARSKFIANNDVIVINKQSLYRRDMLALVIVNRSILKMEIKLTKKQFPKHENDMR